MPFFFNWNGQAYCVLLWSLLNDRRSGWVKDVKNISTAWSFISRAVRDCSRIANNIFSQINILRNQQIRVLRTLRSYTNVKIKNEKRESLKFIVSSLVWILDRICFYLWIWKCCSYFLSPSNRRNKYCNLRTFNNWLILFLRFRHKFRKLCFQPRPAFPSHTISALALSLFYFLRV